MIQQYKSNISFDMSHLACIGFISCATGTMYMKHSEFSGGLGIVVHILPRQICDLTTLKGCKFGYFDNRSEFAMFFATFHTLDRCGALK